MSDTVHSPEREARPAISPKARLLRKQRSRQDSERSRQSFGSGSLHRRLSYRRQSSLGLPHCDSFRSIILEPKEDIEISKEGGKCIPIYMYDIVLKDMFSLCLGNTLVGKFIVYSLQKLPIPRLVRLILS